MSCGAPRLLSYYSPKVNIYDSNCFIPLPIWRSCPPPSCIYIAPNLVYPPAGPYVPPAVCPMPQALNPPGAYCGQIIAPCKTVCGQLGTEVPCNTTCGTKPQTIGCAPSVGTTPSGCSSCR